MHLSNAKRATGGATSKLLSMLLAIVLALGLMPAVPGMALASEVDPGQSQTVVANTTFQENVPIVTASGENGTTGMFFYVVSDATDDANGTVFIGKGTDAGAWVHAAPYPSCTTDTTFKEISLPSTIAHDGKTYDVVGLAVQAFGGGNEWGSSPYSNLEKVTIPASIDRVGNHAFAGCANLKTIDIEEGALEGLIQNPGNQVSSNWMFALTGIEAISLPDSLHYIPNNFLSGCKNLKTVEFRGDASEIAEQTRITETSNTQIQTPVETVIYNGKKSGITWANSAPKPTEYYTVTYVDGAANQNVLAMLKVKAGSDLSKLDDADVLTTAAYPGKVSDIPAGAQVVQEGGIDEASLNDSCTVAINGSAVQRYTASVAENIEHGSVSLSATNNLNEGDTVDIAVSPDNGYELESLTYSYGDVATSLDVKAGVYDYSFSMPASNVTVSATFAAQQPSAYPGEQGNHDGTTSGGSSVCITGMGLPAMTGSDITTLWYNQRMYMNKINPTFYDAFDISFDWYIIGPGGNWAYDQTYDHIKVYSDAELTNVVASFGNGKLVKNGEGANADRWMRTYPFKISAGTLDPGTYYLVFDKDLRTKGPNSSDDQGFLGADVVFQFTVSAAADKPALNQYLSDAQKLIESAKVDTDGRSVPNVERWVTQEEHDALANAIAQAQGVYGNDSATADAVKRTCADLSKAMDEFRSAKKQGLLQLKWNIGKDNEEAATASIDSDGVLTISGAGDVAKFDASAVPWKEYASAVTEIRFDGDVASTQLDNYFASCTSLTKVGAIPASVESMQGTFADCSSLAYAPAVPEKVANLNQAFQDCTSLVSVPSLPASVKTMQSTFSGCSALESIELGSGVEDLSSTFYKCTAMKDIPEIPSSVKTMAATFSGCSGLKKASYPIPDSVTDMSSAFFQCTSLMSAPAIGSSVENMSGAFNGCSALQASPAIPGSVTNAMNAFNNCKKLTVAGAIEEGPTKSAANFRRAFYGCASLAAAPAIPGSIGNAQNMFSGCTSLKTAGAIGDGVTNMSSMFSGCTALEASPAIPNSVTNLSSAFNGCTNLKTAGAIGDGVTTMSGTFSGCIALVSMPDIPASVSTLSRAFEGCSSLSEVGEVKAASKLDYAFKGCASMKVAPRIDAVSSAGKNMLETFAGCSSLEAIETFPSGVITLQRTFSNCTSLVSVPDLPSGMKNISQAFEGCVSLLNAPKLPTTITDMSEAFSGCVSLGLPAGFFIPEGAKASQAFMVGNPYDDNNLLPIEVDGAIDKSVLSYDWTSDNRRIKAKGPIDKSKLLSEIIDANKAVDSVIVVSDLSDVPSNVGSTSSEEISKLVQGSNDAFEALNRPNVSQEDIDTANSRLLEVRSSFDAALRYGESGLVAVETWNIGRENAGDVKASLCEDGSLVFYGRGNTVEYASWNSPWYASGNNSVRSIKFGKDVTPTSLAYYFYNLPNLTMVCGIPDTVENMKNAFKKCASLKVVPNIPDSVVDMESAFEGCSSLENVGTIGSSVANMTKAFYQCESLKSIGAIPDSVTTLKSTFGMCSSLESIGTIGSSVKDMSSAFSNCRSLNSVGDIPDSVTTLYYAFANCTSLKSIGEIGANVENMQAAFFQCSSLVMAPVIPENVTNMKNAFNACPSLALPERFELPKGFDPANDNYKDAFLNKEKGILDTVYVGELSESVKAVDWEKTYNRRLVKPATSDEVSGLLSMSEIAKAKAEGVSASVDGTDVASDAKWDSAEAVTALADAIAAAERYLGTDAPVSQPGVQQAKKDLESAVRALNPKAGLAATADSVSSLRALAASSRLALAGVAESADGSDVAQGTLWATPDSIAAVKSAIEAAQAEVAKDKPQQADVDAAYAALVGAVEAFNPEHGTYVAPEPADYSCGFYDVATELAAVADPANVWYVKGGYLVYVSDNGLIKGYEGTTLFGTHDQITRAQLAAILCRAAGAGDAAAKATADTTGLSDIAAGGVWYTGYVNWAFEDGVVTGNDDGTFRPDDPVTREEMAVMIARYAKSRGADVDGASLDALKIMSDWGSVSAWAQQSLAWCAANDIITGVDMGNGEFQAQPQRSAERIEAAKVVTVLLRDVVK